MTERQQRLRLRCSNCDRVVGHLERWPDRWMQDDLMQKLTTTTAAWPCRCGHAPPVNTQKLAAAAVIADGLGKDLILGAPRYGLPHSAYTV